MLKRKKVYICDHCGEVALEETYCFYSDIWKGPPEERYPIQEQTRLLIPI